MEPIVTMACRTDLEGVVGANVDTARKSYLRLGFLTAFNGLVVLLAASVLGALYGYVTAVCLGISYAFPRKRPYRDAYSQPGVAKRFADPASFTFEEAGLRIDFGSGVKSFLPWTTIQRTKKYPGGTAVFLTEMHFHFVSDSSFYSAEERERAWTFARAAMGNRS